MRCARLPAERRALGHTRPLAQRAAIVDTQLAHHVRDVEFDGIESDALPGGDLPVGHAVLDRMHNPPLTRCEYIVVGWPPSAAVRRHPRILAGTTPIFPTPRVYY